MEQREKCTLVSIGTTNYEMLVKAWPLRCSHHHSARLFRAEPFLAGVLGWRTSTSPWRASVAGKAALAVQTGMNPRILGRGTTPREIALSYEIAVITACFLGRCFASDFLHSTAKVLFTSLRDAKDTPAASSLQDLVAK